MAPAMAAAYQAVGLSTAEIEILAKAQKKRDYYYRSVKGRRLFQLGLGPAALAFVGASSESDQRFMDEMIARRDTTEYAAALLERRGVAWAAEELRGQQPPAAPSCPPSPPEPTTLPDAETVRVPDLREHADTIPVPNPFEDEAPTIRVAIDRRRLQRPRVRRIDTGARSTS
jgi:hypothetical protein